jgi:signal transduction histidine kinase
LITDLQRIQSAGKHLLALINGILDLSKIEAGRMTLEPEWFDVRRAVDELIDTVGPLVHKNDNSLTVSYSDDLGSMSADLMRTRQILLNLLSNASKFTRGGTIALDIRRETRTNGAAIVFTVSDTGVGMTAEQTAKIFEPFTQADVTTTRRYGGTGLGLAIVSRFCGLMGGAVAVESEAGRGARFTVTLPVEMTEAAEHAAASAAAV